MPCSKNGDRKLPTAGEELANTQNQRIQILFYVMFHHMNPCSMILAIVVNLCAFVNGGR